MSDESDIITYPQRTTGGRSFRCSKRTAAHLDATKVALEAQHPGAQLLIIQGCYNTGVAASAGTHDKDRVLDVYIPTLGWWAAQRFLREQGWAAWYRYPPLFGYHIHMVSLGGDQPVGVYVPRQISDYYAGLNGLAGHARDTSWHPSNIDRTIFTYTEKDWFDMATEADLRQIVREELAAERPRTVKAVWQTVLPLAGGRFTSTALSQGFNALLALAKRAEPNVSYDEIRSTK